MLQPSEVFSLLFTLSMAWSGLLLAAIKWLLDKNQTHQDKRFHALEESHKTQEAERVRNERALLELKATLSNEYVRREDWIRFGNVLDAKMDSLNSKIDRLREVMHGSRD